ncbi:ricin-type beta-trefoil lectin domain protein [Hamadaea tsunoensis]|uniref:ricin-type beta-trefoil lectin domain protein n=1 Tax=Hamadaea tsunoensis TaxID=53368 RepID=UPI0003FC8E97|nr:ricin-type beta-trefoil lectin domain protein [Hamadaea tsunoensis]
MLSRSTARRRAPLRMALGSALVLGVALAPANATLAAPQGPSPRSATPVPVDAKATPAHSGAASPSADLMAHPKTESWPFGTKTLPGPAADPLQAAMGKALGAARDTHKPVPVAEATTPYVTLVANPDGTFTARQDVQPQRARKGDRWVPIDTTLAAGADGRVRPQATAVAVSFSGGGAGPLATEDDGHGRQLTFTWPTALPAPALDGATATYADVYPGVDLQLVAEPSGLRNLFVIHDARAAANPALASLALGVKATGLTVSTGTDGGVQALDASGRRVFAGTTPMMWDSSGTSTGADRSAVAPRPRSARMAVKVDGHGVAVLPDRALLTAKSSVFPIVVDPQWTGVAQDWIEMESNGTTVYHGSWSPWAGYDTRVVRVGNSGGTLFRSLMSFDATQLPRLGHTAGTTEALYVVAANLSLHRQTVNGNCVNTDVWRANPFNSNSNWSNQNGGSNTNLWPTSGSTSDGRSWSNPIGRSAACLSDVSTIDITQQVRDVYNWGGSSYTLGLRATNEGPSSGNYAGFNVQNSDSTGGNSYVAITYVAEPTLGGITVGNGIVGNHGAQVNPCGTDEAHAGYLPMQTAAIPVTAAINELDPSRWVQSWMGLNDLTDFSGGTQFTSGIAAVGSSVARADLSATVSTADGNGAPYGNALQLKDGHKYELWATANDDVNYTLQYNGQYKNPYGAELDAALTQAINTRGSEDPYSTPCYFIASMTAPQQATFTHSDFPAAGQHLASYPTVGTVGRIGVASTAVTPIVRFDYAINTDSTNEGAGHCPTTSPADACGSVAATGTSAAADVTIPADSTHQGMNHLFVSAVDAAGNVSKYARFDFFMAAAYQKVNFGDVTGDGVPDVMAVDGSGNLVTYPTNLDPTPAAANVRRAAPAASAPNGTSWATSLYTHRGAVRGQTTDDLFAWGKDANGDGHLYYYYNAQQPGAGALTDAFTQAAQALITRPNCAPSAANAYCTGYDQTTWNNVVQIAAIGPVLGGCDISAPTTACKTYLITVEKDPAGGPSRMWLFSPAAVGRLTNPVLLSTSTVDWRWDTTTLLVPGNAAGHAGGSGGMPDLWARDADGTLWQFTNLSTATTVGAGLGDLSRKTQLGQAGEFRTYKWINSAGDLNADGGPDLWTMDQQGQLGVVLSPFGTGSSTSNALYAQKVNNASALQWATLSAAPTVQSAAPTAGLAGQLVVDQGDGNDSTRRLCLDDFYGNTADGSVVDVYDCNGTGPQQWRFAPDGTVQVLGAAGKCLDTGGSLILGAKISVYGCSSGRTAYQNWRMVPSPSSPGRFQLYNPASGLCLDDTGYSVVNGMQFQLWQCWDGAPQRFSLPTGPNQVQQTEAESVWYATSGGSYLKQTNCCNVSWSNGAQAMLVNSAVNSSLTLSYYVANAGYYKVNPMMTSAVDYGRVTLTVDSTTLPNTFDGYYTAVRATPYNFGSIYLGVGTHTFAFKATGTNAASTGNRYNLGVDTLQLVPTNGTAASAALTVTPSSGTAPLAVTASAAGSRPAGTPISTYTFDFGDGTVVGPQSGSSAGHTYTGGGTFLVRVTVTDTAGNKSAATAGVVVS